MEEQNKKHPLDILAENLFEKDRNYTTTNEIKEFGLAKVDYTYDEDLALHVGIPLEYNKKVTWRTFPTDDFNFPELNCELGAEKEFDRDFLQHNISADGFMVSEKAKKLLEQFDLGEHRFYPLTIISGEPQQMQVALTNGQILQLNNIKSDKNTTRKTHKFFWLHLVFDAERKNYIDFKNSLFTVEIRIKGKTIEKKEIRFESLTEFLEYRKDKHKSWSENTKENPFYEVRALLLQIEPVKLPDILSFGTIDALNIYFSSKLISAIKNEDLKGISFLGTKKLQLTPHKK